MEPPQHDGEGPEVEHRAQRAEAQHEAADEADVPVRRSAELVQPSWRSITSPGTSSTTSSRVGFPLRQTVVWCLIRVWRASAATSARYSLTNPSPTESARSSTMITASVPCPRKYDAVAAS